MKYLLILISTTLLFCSCKTTLGTRPDKHPRPYAITKSGNILPIDSIQKKRGPLLSNGVKCNLDSLEEYCDGKHEYKRLNKNTFAVKRFEGDFKIYTSTSTYTSFDYTPASAGMPGGFKSSSHSHTSYYMRTSPSAALQLINYKNVEAALHKDEPAYRYMALYHRQKTAGKITLWAGLGVFVGGIVLASTSNSDGGDALAGAIIFTGLMAMPTGLIIKGSAVGKIFKAVAKHNGVR